MFFQRLFLWMKTLSGTFSNEGILGNRGKSARKQQIKKVREDFVITLKCFDAFPSTMSRLENSSSAEDGCMDH